MEARDAKAVFDADNAIASSRTMGAAVAAFYMELVVAGVAPAVATTLTYGFIQHVLGTRRAVEPPKPEPPRS
jgi:hypothetical protein